MGARGTGVGTGRKVRPSPVVATLRLLPEASARMTAWVAALTAFTALLPAALALAGGLLVGSIGGAVDDGWDSPAGRRLVAGIVAVVVLFVVQQLSAPALRGVAEALGRRVDGHLRARVMAATLRPSGVAHLEDPDVADRVSAAQAVGTGQSSVTEAVAGLAAVASNTLAGLLAAVVLARFRWWLGLVLPAVYAVLAWVRAHHLRGMADALRGHVRRFRRSSYFRDLGLRPGAAKEIGVFGLGGWVEDRFAGEWDVAMRAFWRDRPKARWLPPLCAVLMAGGLGLTYVLLARAAANGEISVGQLAMFAGAATGVSSIAIVGWDNVNIIYGTAAVPAALELEELLAEPRFVLPGDHPADGLPSDCIQFEAVSFQYPGREGHVFCHLDLEIPAGKSLAIVGPNGAGKTSLVKLLTRLYDPTGGRITVDGVDLATIDARAWQRRMAAIFQDFVHYELSAGDNVGFGAVERLHDDAALAGAARRAGAEELIEGLPGGWDSVLSRRARGGVDLSGGQWQRVALARALFAVDGGASVLILDEPTAALDVRAEAAFYDRFLELTRGITTIVISHRFSTVRRADRIVVIEDGRVSETGDHGSLLDAGGRYAHMFQLQAARLATGLDGEGGDDG